MRNLTKLVATAALGVAMSMSISAPSFAFTDNVKEASSYFFDCLAKLGTDETCGGPHEMNTGTGSISSLSGPSGYPCERWETLVRYGDGYVCTCWHVKNSAR